MRSFTFLSSVAAAIALSFVGPGALAAECTSPSSCARQLACPAGFTVDDSAAGRKGFCKAQVAEDLDTPTCVGKGPMPKPWKWAPGVKIDSFNGICVTYDAKGEVSDTSKEAITCKPDYDHKPALGKCKREASTRYAKPSLATGATVAAVPATCTGESACTKSLECAAGYTLKQHEGPKFYCFKEAASATATPTCQGKGPLPKPWKWAPNVKIDGYNGMCVTYDGKGEVSDTSKEAIKCPAGFELNKGAGLCEKDAATFHATPKLD